MSPDSILLGYRKELGSRKYSAVRNLKMKFAGVKEYVRGNECKHTSGQDRSVQVSSVQSLNCVSLFATPRTAECQVYMSITISQSLLKFMSIESVMPSSHLILRLSLLFLPSIYPSIRVFSNESALHIGWPKDWSFSFSISHSSEHRGLISFRMDWLDLPVQGTLKSLL